MRITPAWAGKRLSPVTPYNPPSDHPRMGGEKGTQGLKGQAWEGSPPRGRGKERGRLHHPAAAGITPAWAGKRIQKNPGGGL